MWPRSTRVTRAVAQIRDNAAVLDGEIVAIDEHGRPSFQALHSRRAAPLATPLTVSHRVCVPEVSHVPDLATCLAAPIARGGDDFRERSDRL